jgi:hypothetical protein
MSNSNYTKVPLSIVAIFSSVPVIVAGRIKSKWDMNDNNAIIATIIHITYNGPPANPKLHYAFTGCLMFLIRAGHLLFTLFIHYTKYYLWVRDSLRIIFSNCNLRCILPVFFRTSDDFYYIC